MTPSGSSLIRAQRLVKAIDWSAPRSPMVKQRHQRCRRRGDRHCNHQSAFCPDRIDERRPACAQAFCRVSDRHDDGDAGLVPIPFRQQIRRDTDLSHLGRQRERSSARPADALRARPDHRCRFTGSTLRPLVLKVASDTGRRPGRPAPGELTQGLEPPPGAHTMVRASPDRSSNAAALARQSTITR